MILLQQNDSQQANFCFVVVCTFSRAVKFLTFFTLTCRCFWAFKFRQFCSFGCSLQCFLLVGAHCWHITFPISGHRYHPAIGILLPRTQALWRKLHQILLHKGTEKEHPVSSSFFWDSMPLSSMVCHSHSCEKLADRYRGRPWMAGSLTMADEEQSTGRPWTQHVTHPFPPLLTSLTSI